MQTLKRRPSEIAFGGHQKSVDLPLEGCLHMRNSPKAQEQQAFSCALGNLPSRCGCTANQMKTNCFRFEQQS